MSLFVYWQQYEALLESHGMGLRKVMVGFEPSQSKALSKVASPSAVVLLIPWLSAVVVLLLNIMIDAYSVPHLALFAP